MTNKLKLTNIFKEIWVTNVKGLKQLNTVLKVCFEFSTHYLISTKGAQTYCMGLRCFCVCCWIPISALRNTPPFTDMHFNALIITLDYTNPYIVRH